MPKFIDLQGRRFGRLIVLYRDMTGHSNDRHTYWVCKCDCGRLKTVRSDDLRSGLVVSCGCYHAEVSSKIGSYINLKHGMSNSRLYKIWVGIKSRCYNKNVPAYKDYGGRGIFVCQSWAENFGEFEKWSFEHGYSDDLEVDRIDNNGPYSPQNCRWVSRKENCRNRRNNYQVEVNGTTYQSVAEAAERLKILPTTLNNQIKKHGKQLCFIERGGKRVWSSAS